LNGLESPGPSCRTRNPRLDRRVSVCSASVSRCHHSRLLLFSFFSLGAGPGLQQLVLAATLLTSTTAPPSRGRRLPSLLPAIFWLPPLWNFRVLPCSQEDSKQQRRVSQANIPTTSTSSSLLQTLGPPTHSPLHARFSCPLFCLCVASSTSAAASRAPCRVRLTRGTFALTL
jgi:hypothetical protein